MNEGPMVVNERAADRLCTAIERLAPSLGIVAPTRTQVAAVLHALSDYTALESAINWRRPDDHILSPDVIALGRWLHDVGDQLRGDR